MSCSVPTEQGSSSRRSGHPNANAHAERWVGTVRSECLVWTLIRGQGHLELVLRTYVDDYNAHPPTEALDSVLRGAKETDRDYPDKVETGSRSVRSGDSSTNTGWRRDDRLFLPEGFRHPSSDDPNR